MNPLSLMNLVFFSQLYMENHSINKGTIYIALTHMWSVASWTQEMSYCLLVHKDQWRIQDVRKGVARGKTFVGPCPF